MKRVLTGIASAVVFVALVQAQEAMSGKWQEETKNGNQIVLDVKATKTALTGTLIFNGQPATDRRRQGLEEHVYVQGDRRRSAGRVRWRARRRSDHVLAGPGGPSGAIVLKRVKTKG